MIMICVQVWCKAVSFVVSYVSKNSLSYPEYQQIVQFVVDRSRSIRMLVAIQSFALTGTALIL